MTDERDPGYDVDDGPSCDCCTWGTDDLREVKYRPRDEEVTIHLCEFCYSTFIGNIFQYPSHYGDNGNYALARSMGWIANRLMHELRELNRKE